jgi:hypothetical protein
VCKDEVNVTLRPRAEFFEGEKVQRHRSTEISINFSDASHIIHPFSLENKNNKRLQHYVSDK